MHRYVTFPRHEEAAGSVSRALPQLYATASPDSALTAATMACAMGRMAIHTGRMYYEQVSISKYIKAVRMVNEAIPDRKNFMSDHLVQAILMLGWWEVSYLEVVL